MVTRDSLELDWNCDAWDMFHEGDIHDFDSYNRMMSEWIYTKTIYDRDCKDIVSTHHNPFNMEYGTPTSWSAAAYDVLYSYLKDNLTWQQILDYCEEEGIYI